MYSGVMTSLPPLIWRLRTACASDQKGVLLLVAALGGLLGGFPVASGKSIKKPLFWVLSLGFRVFCFGCSAASLLS